MPSGVPRVPRARPPPRRPGVQPQVPRPRRRHDRRARRGAFRQATGRAERCRRVDWSRSIRRDRRLACTVGERAGLREGGAIALDDRWGNDVVMLRFEQQDIALEHRAGTQGAIRHGLDEAAAIGAQVVILVQLQFRKLPAGVDVERRGAQCQPRHRPHRRQDRRQVAAIAAADDGDRRAVDKRVRGQLVVGGQQVVQVALARYLVALRPGAGVPAQVERQARATECGDLAGARKVLLLATTPAMYEEHAGNEQARQRRAFHRCGRSRPGWLPSVHESPWRCSCAYLVIGPRRSSTPEK